MKKLYPLSLKSKEEMETFELVGLRMESNALAYSPSPQNFLIFLDFSINVLLFSNAVDEPLKKSFQNINHRHESETLVRFLKARDGNVLDAHQMLIDCLKWRIQNQIDNIQLKPIDTHMYASIQESQLVGISGYSKEGLAVIAIGVGLSTYDKASLRYHIIFQCFFVLHLTSYE
ncbi:uncharacterized protein LOC142538469 [Primulina tabacum]|uniref:uncharacterized protein LOC142538469 n=1 Tax=Primulina tabacum TaxID=48773 RepID=UPI003F592773